MGRVITTQTDLSSYIGQTVKISGSDCCWTVIGQAAPDVTVREVTVTSTECYYYGSVALTTGEAVIISL